MSNVSVYADSSGTILFDADIAAHLHHDWFTPACWEAQGRLRGRGGGRGGAYFIETPAGSCVLRHYYRGGRVASVLGDRYLWTGRDRTRSVAEFHLLQALHQRKLPVPMVVAARYRRTGIHYSADLITRQLPGATLAQGLHEGVLSDELAARVGTVLGQFHRQGVYHADLNAHNILVDANDTYLIDFDRGQLRTPARAWQRANLARLRRSLLKLGVAEADPAFERGLWPHLLRAYDEALGA